MPGDRVPVMSADGRILLNPDGTIKYATLDENGNVPAGCCCEQSTPPCSCCNLASTPSTRPASVIVTFTGVGNNGCADCAAFNTAFELQLDPTDENNCSWLLDEGLPCGIDRIEAEITCEGPGSGLELYFYSVFIHYAPGYNPDGHFAIGLSFTPLDCSNIGVCTYQSATSENIECDWSGATCTVSS